MKKLFSVLLVLTLLANVLLLSGCSASQPKEQETPLEQETAKVQESLKDEEAAKDQEPAKAQESAKEEEPAKEHEPLTMITANFVYKDLLDGFAEYAPEVKIDLISYSGSNMTAYTRNSLKAGQIPDIYATSYLQDANAMKDNLIDLSKYGFVNNYTDSMLRTVSVDGGIYLLPAFYNIFGMYYNKTVFEKYGWEVPQSFEELLELKEKCEAEGIEPFRSRMDLNGYIFGYMFGLGNTMFFDTLEGMKWKQDFLTGDADATGTLEPVLEYMKKWIDAGFIDAKDIGNNSSNPAFMGGLAAMHLCNAYSVKSLDWSKREDHPEYGLQEYGIIPFLSEDGENNMLVSNIQRFYGLSKELEKPGNEQKLADALKFIEYISTETGSTQLGTNGNTVLSTLIGSEVSEDSFYAEVMDVVEEGQITGFVWSGWEDIVNEMADVLHEFVRGNIDIPEVCAAFDEIRNNYLKNGYAYVAISEDDLDMEDVARLTGIAQIRATGADVAIMSLPDFFGFEKLVDREGYNTMQNTKGIAGKLFANQRIGAEEINMIRQSGKQLCTITMTGKEIKDLEAKGLKLFESQSGNFRYVLAVKDDAELIDTASYVVVFAEEEIYGLEEGDFTKLEITPYEALNNYLTELGTFGKDDIHW